MSQQTNEQQALHTTEQELLDRERISYGFTLVRPTQSVVCVCAVGVCV